MRWACYFWLLALSFLQAETVVERDEWALLKMQGQPAGYHHSVTKKLTTPQGVRYLTEKTEEMRMQRMGTAMVTRTHSTVTENERGVVLNFSNRQESQGPDMESHGFRVGEQIVVLARGLEQRYGVPSTVLGPREADRLTRALPLRPGEKISLPIFLEEFPQTLVTMQAEVGLKEKRAVQGVERDLWKIDSRLSVLPGIKISVWVNEQADTILSVLPFPGLGELEMVTCTKEEALQAKGAPELFVGTMIRPDRPLKNYRQLTEVRLRLSGAQRIELAAGPEQEIVSCTDAATEIRIRVPQIEAKAVTWKLPAKVTPELKAYLQPAPLIDANEPLVAQLARQAVGSETNPLLAARKIEAFVRSYITDKTMKVNFASAGQTAHARAGDCTEHGVLCAALGRAVGLPTRVVVGLGYLPTNYDGTEPSANGEFGFHLWAEAWLGEGRWVAMDAALGQFDVGHIAIFKTALESANPTVELAQPVLALMEKLKIEVLEMK